MHFKRLGFCDFWIVKGYMCKKDVAGDQNSANADTCSAPAVSSKQRCFPLALLQHELSAPASNSVLLSRYSSGNLQRQPSELGQKCTVILHFKPLGVSEISEDPSGE